MRILGCRANFFNQDNLRHIAILSSKLKKCSHYDIKTAHVCTQQSHQRPTYIPHNEYFDMTQLIEKLLQHKLDVGSFPLTDYWLDVGRMEDFKRAHEDYEDYFG